MVLGSRSVFGFTQFFQERVEFLILGGDRPGTLRLDRGRLGGLAGGPFRGLFLRCRCTGTVLGLGLLLALGTGGPSLGSLGGFFLGGFHLFVGLRGRLV